MSFRTTISCLPGLIGVLITGLAAAGPFDNLTYSGIFDKPVPLENGRWSGEPFIPGSASHPEVGLVKDFVLSGDLDGDGKDEKAVLLWENAGGSGTNLYLAVLKQEDEHFVNVATALIGDRVQVRSGSMEDGRIRLQVVQPGQGDAACCPSGKALRSWTLADGRLKEAPAKMTGTLSLKDLEGTTWVLTGTSKQPIDPNGPKITLEFQGDRIAGKGGCNRYFATVKPGELPGRLSVGQPGSTRMACPGEIMNREERYLGALGSITGFRFVGGRLALDGSIGGQSFSLIFEPDTKETAGR